MDRHLPDGRCLSMGIGFGFLIEIDFGSVLVAGLD